MQANVLNADQFSGLCDAVFQAAASASSCTAGELDRESLFLKLAATELGNAKLVRHSQRLIERRRLALARSSEVLARRRA